MMSHQNSQRRDDDVNFAMSLAYKVEKKGTFPLAVTAFLGTGTGAHCDRLALVQMIYPRHTAVRKVHRHAGPCQRLQFVCKVEHRNSIRHIGGGGGGRGGNGPG